MTDLDPMMEAINNNNLLQAPVLIILMVNLINLDSPDKIELIQDNLDNKDKINKDSREINFSQDQEL